MSVQTIKVRNPLYEVRDRYFFYISEFEEFTGEVIKNPAWIDDDYVTMTTGNSVYPLRFLRKDTIVGFEAPSKIQAPAWETFEIKSSSRKGGSYVVTRNGKSWSCNCIGFGFHKNCRHIKEAKSLKSGIDK